VSPSVERLIAFNGSLPLAEVARVAALATNLTGPTPHVFTDEDPADVAILEAIAQRDDVRWPSELSRWPDERRTPRRWGDAWTMIDLRDPTVISEESTSVRSAFSGQSTLFLHLPAAGDCCIRIDAVGEETAEPGSPAIRVIGGLGIILLAEGETIEDYARLVEAAAEPERPDHVSALKVLDSRVGPWADFASQRFDPAGWQQRIDAPEPRFESGWPPRRRTLLESLTASFPASNAAGLRAHIGRTGVMLPGVVTRAEVAAFVAPMRWPVAEVADDGVRLDGWQLPADFVAEWAGALGVEPEAMPDLVTAAFRLNLIRRFRGCVMTKNAARDALADPMAMWMLLAEAFASRLRGDTAGTMLTLALADGSIDDADLVAARMVTGLAIAHHRPYERWDRPLRLPPTESEAVRREVAPAVRLYSAVGLEATPDQGWRASRTLREFARAVLHVTGY